jgi:hypothetical protein
MASPAVYTAIQVVCLMGSLHKRLPFFFVASFGKLSVRAESRTTTALFSTSLELTASSNATPSPHHTWPYTSYKAASGGCLSQGHGIESNRKLAKPSVLSDHQPFRCRQSRIRIQNLNEIDSSLKVATIDFEGIF